MKLKTLKDLQKDYEWNYNTYRALRQEAIKHIKSGTMVEGAKFWAIGFFNLTKEELK